MTTKCNGYTAHGILKVVMLALMSRMGITRGHKMINVKTIASYMISRSSKLNESNDLTNLKLQKILFYTQASYLKKTGGLLFDEAVEAWEYGPVVCSVYHWLKGCGAYPIAAFDLELDDSTITEKEEKELSSIWDEYSKYSAAFLVEKTHETNSPWHIAFHRTNKTIELDEIKLTKLANEW
jgi:uncharacterized phage-associated protein